MTQSVKGIAPLIAAVQIEDIRLTEATVRTKISSPKDVDEVDLVLDTSAIVKEHHPPEPFVVLATIDAKLVPRRTPESAAVSIKAGFELRYSLPPDLRVSRRDLNTFARINSVFNVWPYWREFIQSMTTRMHLPPLVLPVFRVREAAKRISRKASSTTNSTLPAIPQDDASAATARPS